ncbi:aquaporin [Shigella flexneri]
MRLLVSRGNQCHLGTGGGNRHVPDAGVSGAHLDPTVTIALSLFACFDKRKVIPFIVSQVAGAFCAAALVYGLYYNLFDFRADSSHCSRQRGIVEISLALFSTCLILISICRLSRLRW